MSWMPLRSVPSLLAAAFLVPLLVAARGAAVVPKGGAARSRAAPRSLTARSAALPVSERWPAEPRTMRYGHVRTSTSYLPSSPAMPGQSLSPWTFTYQVPGP